MNRSELIQDLRERLRQIECSHRPVQEPTVSTGVLDRLLPAKGLQWGTLIEWLSEGEGSGAATLALALTPALLERGGVLVMIDSKREFYPPAAAALGIPLDHLVLVHPESVRAGLWAWEQCLRSRAVAVALGWLGSLNTRSFRRLQLAAEAGGSLGFLLRPRSCRAEPSWAEARLLVKALPTHQVVSGGVVSGGVVNGVGHHSPLTTHHSPLTQSSRRRLHVEVLHCRGGAAGEAIELELSHETGSVRLASRLAPAASPTRAAGA